MEREKIVARKKSREIFQAVDWAGIHWPIDEDVTNGKLELLLFPGKYSAVSLYVEPNYPYIHLELAVAWRHADAIVEEILPEEP